ncbi:MAG TPA: DUF2510 domain-containing protein [Actinomycetes bacterium]
MTETVQSTDPSGPPAPGWYADPGGSGGARWWNGQGWTETVRMPAPAVPLAPAVQAAPAAPPAPEAPPAPAAPAIDYVIQAATADLPPAPSRFGGPAEPVQPVLPVPAPPGHRAASHHQVASGPSMSTRTKVLLAVLAVLVIAGCVLWFKLMSGGTAATPLGGFGGARGPAAAASTKVDAQSIAAAEETVYSTQQVYLPFGPSTDIVVLGKTEIRLSPQNTASVVLNGSATGYCILVVSKSPTTKATSTSVYVSTLGGLQLLATTCPATF